MLCEEDPGVASSLPGSNPDHELGDADLDPYYDGLRSSHRIAGYRPLAGRLFIRGEGDAHAVAANDARVGSLGDSYLMASLAAVASTQPGLIEQMLREKEDGTYAVRLFEKHAEWLWYLPVRLGKDLPGTTRFRDVVVDAEFPMAILDSPVFGWGGDTDGEDHELWSMLVEKAYAKLKGDYASIDQGQAAFVLNSITGAGADVRRLRRGVERQVYRHLRSALAEGRPVVLESRSYQRLPYGIDSNSAYALVGVEGNRFQLFDPSEGDRSQPRPLRVQELIRAFRTVTVGN